MTFYVLHSPYPDGSWRGWAKCAGACLDGSAVSDGEHPAGVVLFESSEDAEQALRNLGENRDRFVVWPIEVAVPDVRSRRPL